MIYKILFVSFFYLLLLLSFLEQFDFEFFLVGGQKYTIMGYFYSIPIKIRVCK